MKSRKEKKTMNIIIFVLFTLYQKVVYFLKHVLIIISYLINVVVLVQNGNHLFVVQEKIHENILFH
jgi:hypothetical protein